MLALAADPRMLRTGGLLFVSLPSASLDNSRYCNQEHFLALARTLGLECLEVTRSAKLILMTFRRRGEEDGGCCYDATTRSFDYSTVGEVGRKTLQAGASHNNFCVMLKSSARGTRDP